jgi:hypothetical protein
MGPVPPGSGISGPDIPQGDRLALARQVLTDAGWTYDENAKVWSEREAEALARFHHHHDIECAGAEDARVVHREDWQALGVPTSLTYDDPNALVSSAIRPRNYEALFFGMVVGRDQDLFPFWDSSQKQDPGLNIAMYTNKNVDQLLEKRSPGERPRSARRTCRK